MKGILMKKTIALLLAAVMLSGICGCAKPGEGNTTGTAGTTGGKTTVSTGDSQTTDKPDDTTKTPDDTNVRVRMSGKPKEIKETDFSGYGLQVNDEGMITLNGKPFYGYGVNFHPAFHLALDKQFYGDMHTDIEAHFSKLAAEGIPVMRINFNIFYGKDVGLWDKAASKDRWFGAMDYIIALAEKYNIGIIASLFWNVDSFCEYTGDKLDMIISPDSASTLLRMKYIEEVVGRYKYSPAIYAWEIGNELNLAVDIKNTEFIGTDGTKKMFTSEMLTAYYKLIGEAIRKEDPYRMITGGDAAPRLCSMALWRSGGNVWQPNNSYDENKTTFQWYTPAPLDTISLHYPELEYMEDYVKIAKELKIGLYVGEFHSTLFHDNPGDKISPEENENEAREQSTWYEIRDTFERLGVQLTTYWCYGSYSQARRIDSASLELGVLDGYVNNYYVNEGLKEVNEKFISEGKNDAVSYWNSAEYALFGK